MKNWPFILTFISALSAPSLSHGQDLSLHSQWQPIPAWQLDDMRGGYQLSSGMIISFGFERVIHVNGEVISSTHLSIPDVSSMTLQQAQHLSDFTQGTIIRIGEGSSSVLSGGVGGLVIQNDLAGQDIRSTTMLTAGVSTLGMFQAVNAQDALRNALVQGVGSP